MKANICYACLLAVYEPYYIAKNLKACTEWGHCNICLKNTAVYYARVDELQIAKMVTIHD